MFRIGLLATTLIISGCECGESGGPVAGQLTPASLSALEAPDRIELLVLGERVLEPTGNEFDSRRVLAVIEVEAAQHGTLRARLGEALSNPPEAVPMCYEPHHGLRIHRGEAVAEMSICFHCSQLNEFGELPYRVIGNDPDDGLRVALDAIIERDTDYRFDEDRGGFGGWAEEGR